MCEHLTRDFISKMSRCVSAGNMMLEMFYYVENSSNSAVGWYRLGGVDKTKRT